MRSWGKLMSEVSARAASNTPIVRSLSDMEAKPVFNSSPEMKPPAGHLHMSRGRSLPRLFDFARKNNCRTLHNISEACIVANKPKNNPFGHSAKLKSSRP